MMKVLSFSWSLAKFNLKVKYANSQLGVIWIVVNPIILVLAYSVIFSQDKIKELAVFYFIGLSVFSLVNEVMISSSNLILSNAHLIKKVRFEKNAIPLSNVFQVALNHIACILIVIAYLLYFNMFTLSSDMLYFPLYLLFLYLFAVGLGFLIAAIGVFSDDLFQFFSSTSIILLFLSPVFYDYHTIDGLLKTIVTFNPITHFINFFRAVALENVAVNIANVLVCAAISLISLLLGILLYSRVKDDFVDLV